MTYVRKHKENTRLIAGYMAFLSECSTYDQRLKLISEIARLHHQNKQIEQMEYQEVKKEMLVYFIKINSEL